MIFLDSSFLIAYYNSTDEHKNKALDIMDNLIADKYGTPYISDYVFDEVVTILFVRNKDKSIATTLGEILRESLEIINVNEELFGNAWTLFRNQKDTNFSFTDCTNLAIMQYKGILQIATFDEDFTKSKGIKVVS